MTHTVYILGFESNYASPDHKLRVSYHHERIGQKTKCGLKLVDNASGPRTFYDSGYALCEWGCFDLPQREDMCKSCTARYERIQADPEDSMNMCNSCSDSPVVACVACFTCFEMQYPGERHITHHLVCAECVKMPNLSKRH